MYRSVTCMYMYSTCIILIVSFNRVEISKEDDLSLDSDSDMMDVDTVSHDGEEKEKQQGSGSSGGGGGKQVGASGKGGGNGGGFIVTEPLPQYAVSPLKCC